MKKYRKYDSHSSEEKKGFNIRMHYIYNWYLHKVRYNWITTDIVCLLLCV